VKIWRPWLLAWLGGAVLGVGNGTLRELVLRRILAEDAARQLSTLTLLGLLTGYLWLLDRWRPLPSTRTALSVGAVWVVLTIAFDLMLGHYVEHKSWHTLLADYDLSSGKVWVAVPVWTLVAPALVRRARRGSDTRILQSAGV